MPRPSYRLDGALLSIFLLAGCSGSSTFHKDGGVSDEIAKFAEDFAGTICQTYVGCGCPTWSEDYCRQRIAEAAADQLANGPLGRDFFQEDCAAGTLAAIEAYGCRTHVGGDRLGLGADCESFCGLHIGTRQEGESCRGDDLYWVPLSDCARGLVCDDSLTCVRACDARFGSGLAKGERCENGFEVLGQCAVGLVCDSNGTDTCVPLPGEGATCLYDQCLPGLYCEIIVTTKTCRALGGDGDPCPSAKACASGVCAGNLCVGGAPPPAAICAYVDALLGTTEGCRGDADCDDQNACTRDRCVSGRCEFGPPCSGHGNCEGAPRACQCDPGYVDERCESCAPAHRLEGEVCVPDPDPQRFLLVTGSTAEHGEVVAAVEVATGALYPLRAVSGGDLTGLTRDPTTGELYAVDNGYPKRVLRLDLAAGTQTEVVSLLVGGGGYHGVYGLAFDSDLGRLVGHAHTGAAYYTYFANPQGGQLTSQGASIRGAPLGLVYDSNRQVVLAITAGSQQESYEYDYLPYAANAVSVKLGVGLANPGLAFHPDGRLFVSGGRLLDQLGWTAAYCQIAARAFGVDPSDLQFRGGHDYDDVAPGTDAIASDPAGPSLVSYSSYGHADEPKRILRIATTEDADVVCLATYEEQLTVVVDAGARFALLILASFRPTIEVQVEEGFAPAGALEKPIKHAATTGDAPTTLWPEWVEVIDSNAWLFTYHLTHPSYQPDLVVTPVLAELDWATGEVTNLHELGDIELHGGLTGL